MTIKASESIDEFISGLPKEVKVMFQKVPTTIRTIVQYAVEAIEYARPTFLINVKNLAPFVAFNNHTGFYPVPAGIESFQKTLSMYKQGRWAAQFPLDQPMPLKLITEIVKFNLLRIPPVKAKREWCTINWSICRNKYAHDEILFPFQVVAIGLFSIGPALGVAS